MANHGIVNENIHTAETFDRKFHQVRNLGRDREIGAVKAYINTVFAGQIGPCSFRIFGPSKTIQDNAAAFCCKTIGDRKS